jgi:hypothetical protein
LAPEEVELYFRLSIALLLDANRRLRVLPEVDSREDFATASLDAAPEPRSAARSRAGRRPPGPSLTSLLEQPVREIEGLHGSTTAEQKAVSLLGQHGQVGQQLLEHLAVGWAGGIRHIERLEQGCVRVAQGKQERQAGLRLAALGPTRPPPRRPTRQVGRAH